MTVLPVEDTPADALLMTEALRKRGIDCEPFCVADHDRFKRFLRCELPCPAKT